MTIDNANLEKLKALKNAHVLHIVEEYVRLCKPARVRVLTDSEEDLAYVRAKAVADGEERRLGLEGHTIHFDGYYDQGRDSANTRILLPAGARMSEQIRTVDKDEGLAEVRGFLDGIMAGKEMLVCCFCLGPKGSPFRILALQMTDSAYVAHSETILYRPGYEEFKGLAGSDAFFHFIHSSGALDSRGNSKDYVKRRIYIDLEAERVFTVNNQYAGNSVGLKKLALRLAISKANREDWLCEHMFIMGVKRQGRVTYLTGAFPSACGKTSTAMVPGQSIVGDDIAYIRPAEDGRAYAVNVEQGIFGIIQDVNPVDDPVIYTALTTPRELIMSNVLVKDGSASWLGMGKELPASGENFAGSWTKGMKGPDGKEVLPAHKNARYTIRLSELENVDAHLHDPSGVPVSGFIYGGRDSDTSPPVLEALSWQHGVFLGAALESETTSATIGAEGEMKHDPMANLDFLVVPLGTYIRNHLAFGERLDEPPRIFATNYFLKEEGKWLNEKTDKKAWLYWMEGRVHGSFEAIETPIGHLPRYSDLALLFKEALGKEYTQAAYDRQFSVRVPKLLARLDRIETVYRQEDDVPELFHQHLEQQRQRLLDAQKRYGDVIEPRKFG
jgi:phosphoenolpyruvate carboxykinase (GTP)